jgi:hypothetical protein
LCCLLFGGASVAFNGASFQSTDQALQTRISVLASIVTKKLTKGKGLCYKPLACMEPEQLIDNKVEANQKPDWEMTPAELRKLFRQEWGYLYKGEFPTPMEGQKAKDAKGTVYAYEMIFDPIDAGSRHTNVTRFSLEALRAGYEIASTVVLPNVGVRPTGETLAAVTYFLKDPSTVSQNIPPFTSATAEQAAPILPTSLPPQS